MIACYQKNIVRTIFCGVSRLAPETDYEKYWRQYGDRYKTGTTQTKSMLYESFRPRKNVRLLLIKDPIIGNKVRCGIRVGVGSEDDPGVCEGVAHLLEHVVAQEARDHRNAVFEYINAQTEEFETVYEFVTETKEKFMLSIHPLWNYLFSNTSLIGLSSKINLNRRIDTEIARIDNEFHQKHNKHLQIKLAEISKVEDLKLAKFGSGNQSTLKELSRNELIDQLEYLRTLYRTRPINVCVCTGGELNMKDIYTVLNKATPTSVFKVVAENRDTPAWEEDIPNTKLIVMKSDSVVPTLVLLYRLDSSMDIQQINSFKFVIEMIKCQLNKLLVEYLRHKNLATECTAQLYRRNFFIVVSLTNQGLENIRSVSFAVRQYLKYLHEEWKIIETYEYRPHDKRIYEAVGDYAKYIATYMDNEDNEFDEGDVTTPLPIDKEKELLKQQILDNKNFLHIIMEQDLGRVFDVLKEKYNETEAGKKTTTYHVYTTLLFATADEVPVFELENVGRHDILQGESKHSFPATFYVNPTDAMFSLIAAQYLNWQSVHIREIRQRLKSGLNKFAKNTDGLQYLGQGSESDLNEIFKNVHYDKLNEVHFDQCKNHVMGSKWQNMNDSITFANSLILDAVHNNGIRDKNISLPLPLQYEALMDINLEKYNEHFKAFMKRPLIYTPTYNKEISVKAINEIECTTVTLCFCETSPNDRNQSERLRNIIEEYLAENNKTLQLYTCRSSFDTIDGHRGIKIKIVSMEEKENQANDKICKLCDDVFNHLYQKVQTIDDPRLKEAYEYLVHHKILIQIVGHKGHTPSGKKFEDIFKDWLEQNKEKLETLLR